MKHATKVAEMKTKHQKKRGPTRFPGVCQDAEALGVNRVTLYRTLAGEWRLPGLLGRYQALKAQQEKERAAKARAGKEAA